MVSTSAMDTWSLGAIYYKLLYGVNPTFDSLGTLIFPSTRAIKSQQMQRLSYYLALDPNDRKNIYELDPLKQLPA
jgi:serine/threonine protein kinase